ncbi:MAG: hypothetical protein R2793_01460 [Flavobacteriaceae bacterium]
MLKLKKSFVLSCFLFSCGITAFSQKGNDFKDAPLNPMVLTYKTSHFGLLGNVREISDTDKYATHTNYFDEKGFLVKTTYPAGTRTYFYDKKGYPSTIKQEEFDGNAETVFTVNGNGMIVKKIFDGMEMTYEYDASGNLSKSYFDGKMDHSYSYDTKGRIEKIETFFDGEPDMLIQYSYEELNDGMKVTLIENYVQYNSVKTSYKFFNNKGIEYSENKDFPMTYDAKGNWIKMYRPGQKDTVVRKVTYY